MEDNNSDNSNSFDDFEEVMGFHKKRKLRRNRRSRYKGFEIYKEPSHKVNSWCVRHRVLRICKYYESREEAEAGRELLIKEFFSI